MAKAVLNEKIIGENIRRWRQRKGLSLTETAAKAGLTKSALSKIETGQISPPISTVLRIGDALSVSLADFFAEPRNSPNFVLTRKGKGSLIVRDGSQFGYAYEALALEMPGKKAEPFLLNMKPTDPLGRFQHGGQEFIYMLAGRLEMSVGDEKMILNPGDSIYFNPKLPHTARVSGKKPVKFVCIFVQEEPEAEGLAGKSPP